PLAAHEIHALLGLEHRAQRDRYARGGPTRHVRPLHDVGRRHGNDQQLTAEMSMPGQSTMNIRDDVLAAHLEGEAVLLDLQTKRYYRHNATAARIWKGLEQARETTQIVDALVDEFAVDAATAQAELD